MIFTQFWLLLYTVKRRLRQMNCLHLTLKSVQSKRKGKEEYLYSAILYTMYILKHSGINHTVLPANTPCLPFLRKHSPDGVTPKVIWKKPYLHHSQWQMDSSNLDSHPNTRFLESTWVNPPNGISISLAIFAQLDRVPNKHTKHNECGSCNKRPHLCLIRILGCVAQW